MYGRMKKTAYYRNNFGEWKVGFHFKISWSSPWETVFCIKSMPGIMLPAIGGELKEKSGGDRISRVFKTLLWTCRNLFGQPVAYSTNNRTFQASRIRDAFIAPVV